MDTVTLNTTDTAALAADLFKTGQYDRAAQVFSALVEAEPQNLHHAHALAVCLIEADRPAEAMPWLDRAGHLLRDEALALSANRAKALGEIGRSTEALGIYNQLVLAASDAPSFRYGRGLMRMQEGDYRGAIRDFDMVLERVPGDGKATFGRGFANLVLGNYAEGFRDYESRQRDDFPEQSVPLWTGEQDLVGKTILVASEQGLGDGIMFGRYLPLMVARGAKVLALMQPPVAPLIEGMNGVTLVGTDPATWPPFDYWVRTMSLAWCFRTTIETVPPPIAIHYDDGRAIHWKRRMDRGGGLKVGLVWSGSPKSRYDSHRSVPLKALAPLFDLPNVQFYSLQLGVREADREAFDAWTTKFYGARPLVDLSPGLTDFRETAHAMRELDLMVTVDTSVAHLAGTVGVPTLVMLTAFRTYWLWIEKTELSPWYKSIKTIRQEVDGEWGPVIDSVTRRIGDATQQRRIA